MKTTVWLVPTVLAVFSGVVIWASLQLDTSPPMIVGDGMQARSFPIFLMVLNLLLIAILALQMWRTPPKPLSKQRFPTWGTVLLLGLFYALTTWVDMFIGIAVVMFLMSLVWGERRIWLAGLVAIVTPLSIFLLFDLVLRIRFPRGLLTNWYYG